MIEEMIDAKIAHAVRHLHTHLTAGGETGSFGAVTPGGPTTFELARKLEKVLRNR
jgi:hypothetical protein